MSTAPSRLKVTQNDQVTQIDFVDRNILDEANIQQISEEIVSLIDEQTTPRLLINFENVDHLSSAALGALISIKNRIEKKDGQLRLAGIDPQIYEVFVITRLNQVFHIHDTPEQAIASFS